MARPRAEIGAGAGQVSENGADNRVFVSDLGWNDLQRAYFRDTPKALFHAKRNRQAMRRLMGGTR